MFKRNWVSNVELRSYFLVPEARTLRLSFDCSKQLVNAEMRHSCNRPSCQAKTWIDQSLLSVRCTSGRGVCCELGGQNSRGLKVSPRWNTGGPGDLQTSTSTVPCVVPCLGCRCSYVREQGVAWWANSWWRFEIEYSGAVFRWAPFMRVKTTHSVCVSGGQARRNCGIRIQNKYVGLL